MFNKTKLRLDLNLPWHCPLFCWQLQLFHAQQLHIIQGQNPNCNLPNEHQQMEKNHKILLQYLHHPHLSNLFKLVAENFNPGIFNPGIFNPNFLSRIFEPSLFNPRLFNPLRLKFCGWIFGLKSLGWKCPIT